MNNYIKIVNGDLLDSTEQYLAHQCNCCTIRSKHIAKQIFDKYPYSNTYKNRTYDESTRPIPGTIDIMGNGSNQRYIINMYAQYYPSSSKYSNDTKELRISFFKKCLESISQIQEIKEIAMPYKIGCGSASGDWDVYYKIISEFAEKQKINITLYKIDNS